MEALRQWLAENGVSMYAIAKQLKIQRQTMYQWKRIPLSHVDALSKITGISPAELRPDYKELFR